MSVTPQYVLHTLRHCTYYTVSLTCTVHCTYYIYCTWYIQYMFPVSHVCQMLKLHLQHFLKQKNMSRREIIELDKTPEPNDKGPLRRTPSPSAIRILQEDRGRGRRPWQDREDPRLLRDKGCRVLSWQQHPNPQDRRMRRTYSHGQKKSHPPKFRVF